MEILVAGIPRLPGAGSSARGQSGPKTRPKGVVDGQQVNIPAHAVGFKRVVGEGQWRGSMAIPCTARNRRTASGFARVPPCVPASRKSDATLNACRTKTDTGGRVQGYQGAREKPR